MGFPRVKIILLFGGREKPIYNWFLRPILQYLIGILVRFGDEEILPKLSRKGSDLEG